MSSEWANEKAIAMCLIQQPHVWVWSVSKQLLGWHVQPRLRQLAIFIFQGEIPEIIFAFLLLVFTCEIFQRDKNRVGCGVWGRDHWGEQKKKKEKNEILFLKDISSHNKIVLCELVEAS